MPASAKSSCVRCNGLLFGINEEVHCLNCGWRPEPDVPLRIVRKPSHKASRFQKAVSKPTFLDQTDGWLKQNSEMLGLSGAFGAKRMLEQLGAPFMRTYAIQDNGESLVFKYPYFANDDCYKRHANEVGPEGRRKAQRECAGRRKKIDKHMARLPQGHQEKVRQLLRLRSVTTRHFVARTALTIRLLFRTIEEEQRRLKTLQLAANTNSLFQDSVPDALGDYCKSVQAQLEHARTIVQKASELLDPARKSFNKSSSRRDLDAMILKTVASAPGFNKNQAATFVKIILGLADPTRPIKSLRHLHYTPPNSLIFT